MTRIVKEISVSSIITEWRKTRASTQIFLHTFVLLALFISFVHFALQTTYEFIVLFLYQSVEYGSHKVLYIGVKFLVLTLNICKSHFVPL